MVLAWWRARHSDAQRLKEAYRDAMEALKGVQNQSASEGANILTRFLQVKLGRSVRSLTNRELEAVLLKRGLDPQSCTAVLSYLAHWAKRQYAPQGGAVQDRASWVSECEALIQDLRAWEVSSK